MSARAQSARVRLPAVVRASPEPLSNDPEANGVDFSLLEHVNPIEWENVVLYRQYVLNRKLIKRRRAVA